MALKGKPIKSRASGLTGQITGVDKRNLKITFTKFQDVTIPLVKAESLLIMDDETLEELHKEIRESKFIKEIDKVETKVRTYMDDFEEEDEPADEEEPPVQMEFDDVE